MTLLEVQPRLASASDFVDRLLRTSTSIVLFLDPSARIVLFNDSLHDLCGYLLHEVRGQDWFERFVPEPERKQLREQFEVDLRGDDVQSHTTPVVTRTGEVRQIEWRVNAVHADDGELLGLVSVGQDISERLMLRAKLAESERLATIGMMASVFAHEVGNPLNSIYLQIQLLRRQIDRSQRGPLTPKVDAIVSEITRLSELLDDFRAYRDPNKMPLSPTDLKLVIAQVAEVISLRAANRSIEIECKVEPTLTLVLGNRNKLKQVLLSLCKNAIEAMPSGGRLRLEARAEPQHVHIDVIDDGPGVLAQLDVFAPFSTTKTSGMGLGLPLAREIVAAHGGTLSYASLASMSGMSSMSGVSGMSGMSKPGTVFTVSLPLR
jgi:PAS domain S-box-containing protein